METEIDELRQEIRNKGEMIKEHKESNDELEQVSILSKRGLFLSGPSSLRKQDFSAYHGDVEF